MRWRYGDLERGRWMNSWGRWLGRMLPSWWLSGDLDSKVLLCRILNRPGHGDGMSGRRDVNPISAYGIGVSGVVIPIVSSMQIENIILPQTVSDYDASLSYCRAKASGTWPSSSSPGARPCPHSTGTRQPQGSPVSCNGSETFCRTAPSGDAWAKRQAGQTRTV